MQPWGLLANAVLLVLLVALGGWCSKLKAPPLGNATLSRQAQTMAAYESYINGAISAQRLVGREFPRVSMTGVLGESVSTDLSQRRGGLFLVFRPESCQPCLETQLKAMAVMASLVVDRSVVVAAFSSAPEQQLKRLIRAFDLPYPVVSDSDGRICGADLAAATPVVLLANRSQTIVDSHVPSPGRPEISVLFFNQLHLAIREKTGADLRPLGFGLGGVPYVKVIRNEFAPTESVQKILY